MFVPYALSRNTSETIDHNLSKQSSSTKMWINLTFDLFVVFCSQSLSELCTTPATHIIRRLAPAFGPLLLQAHIILRFGQIILYFFCIKLSLAKRLVGLMKLAMYPSCHLSPRNIIQTSITQHKCLSIYLDNMACCCSYILWKLIDQSWLYSCLFFTRRCFRLVISLVEILPSGVITMVGVVWKSARHWQCMLLKTHRSVFWYIYRVLL